MKLVIDDIFRNCYSLTIDDNRFKYQCDVFEYYGLPKPTKFKGLTRESDGPRSCLIGHLSLMMMARSLKLPYITVFEDDAYPCAEIKKDLEHYLSNIPDNCGILCYGYNGVYGSIDVHGDFEIFKEMPYGSHAYTIFSSAYDEFIESLEKQRLVDIALRGDNFKETNKPYWITKYLFVQKNIDNNHMHKTKKQFIYPNPRNRRVFSSNTPPVGFDKFIPGISISSDIVSILKNKYYIKHYGWEGWCSVDIDNKTIDHGKDHGVLSYYMCDRWSIKWDKYDNEEILIPIGDSFRIDKKVDKKS